MKNKEYALIANAVRLMHLINITAHLFQALLDWLSLERSYINLGVTTPTFMLVMAEFQPFSMSGSLCSS